MQGLSLLPSVLGGLFPNDEQFCLARYDSSLGSRIMILTYSFSWPDAIAWFT